jgi:1-acyl-sn-glycerol-3-phosphate acyltransferase
LSAYYSACRSAISGAMKILTGWEIRGREHVPLEGGLIVASNHISFWDPPLVGAAAKRELHFLAKEELFRTPLLGPLIRAYNAIPIRRGMADLRGLSRAIDVLKGGGALMVFPEGSRMKDGQLHPARPGVGLLAVSGNATIVPAFVSGSNRPRRWMLRRGKVRIWFGGARHWRAYAGTEGEPEPGRALYQRIGDGVMHDIAAVRAQQLQAASRGAA